MGDEDGHLDFFFETAAACCEAWYPEGGCEIVDVCDGDGDSGGSIDVDIQMGPPVTRNGRPSVDSTSTSYWYPDILWISCLHGSNPPSIMMGEAHRDFYLFDSEEACCDVHNCVEPPSMVPTDFPTEFPTYFPTEIPTNVPTDIPTYFPTETPTMIPTLEPSGSPTVGPTRSPSVGPTRNPTGSPTASPTKFPTASPTASPIAEASPGPPASASPLTVDMDASSSCGKKYHPYKVMALKTECSNNDDFQPSWSTDASITQYYMFDTPEDCCDFWYPSQDCHVEDTCPTKGPTASPTSAPTAVPTKSPTASTIDYAASFNTCQQQFHPYTITNQRNECSNGIDDRPSNWATDEALMEFYVFDSPEECCWFWYPNRECQVVDKCPTPSPTASPTTSPTNSPTTTIIIVDEEVKVSPGPPAVSPGPPAPKQRAYFPDWIHSITCTRISRAEKSSHLVPDYMYALPDTFFFNDLEACCKEHFDWKLDECRGEEEEVRGVVDVYFRANLILGNVVLPSAGTAMYDAVVHALDASLQPMLSPLSLSEDVEYESITSAIENVVESDTVDEQVISVYDIMLSIYCPEVECPTAYEIYERAFEEATYQLLGKFYSGVYVMNLVTTAEEQEDDEGGDAGDVLEGATFENLSFYGDRYQIRE